MSTIQENNSRLNINNTNLTNILDAINTLPTMILQDKTVLPSVDEQVLSADEGFSGLNNVKILGDEDLLASNIKKGVEIFGVNGSVEELTQETKEAIVRQEGIVTTQSATVSGIKQVVQQKILTKEKFKPRYLYNTLSFQNYTGTELDHEVSMIDTTHLTALNNSFCNCSRITSLDLSEWNTGNVTTMFRTFYWCQSLISLNLSGWNTSNVTTMSNMFDYCNQLSHLDLSSFNTSKVTDMSAMFNMCQKLKHLDIRNFTFDKVSKSSSMFSMVPKDCLIIVKGETEKQWVLNVRNDLTNVKTVAELEV